MYYDYVKKHTELLYRQVLGEDVSEDKKRIENELYIRNKPEIYGGDKGLLIKIEKNFETDCSILYHKGYPEPKKLTVLSFYQASELIEKQAENGKQSKRNKKRK